MVRSVEGVCYWRLQWNVSDEQRGAVQPGQQYMEQHQGDVSPEEQFCHRGDRRHDICHWRIQWGHYYLPRRVLRGKDQRMVRERNLFAK